MIKSAFLGGYYKDVTPEVANRLLKERNDARSWAKAWKRAAKFWYLVTTSYDETDRLLDENQKLRAALGMVEYVADEIGHAYCPWCRTHLYPSGHRPDCPRQLALGL